MTRNKHSSMAGSFEKSVKGATKIKLAPPKAKYVEHILVATHAGDAGVAEIFRALQNRLRDSTWTIVFKALIIVHLMIREGEPSVTLKFLADAPSRLAISSFSDVQIQGTNIRHYYNYILARAKAFKDTRIDWVREGRGRLKRQSIDKGLLRETEAVQGQITSILKCDLLSSDAENEITVCAFRLLTMDLLVLYGVMNEGTINVLEHYFEMSKVDAQRALAIYKTFAKQTNLVVEFLSIARQYENATRLEIPKLKHAPTSLTSSLEEYLNDADFEVNRRQYLAHQESRRDGKTIANGTSAAAPFKKPQPSSTTNARTNSVAGPSNSQMSTSHQAVPKSPAPDLIDFFDSIERYQQPISQQQTSSLQHGAYGALGQQQPLQQVNSQPFEATNPFAPMQQAQPLQPPPPPQQQNFAAAGFNATQTGSQPAFSSYPPQQQPSSTGQTSFAPIQSSFNTGQSQATNPFRQSMFPQHTAAGTSPFPSASPPSQQIQPQHTNPFGPQPTGQIGNSPFAQPNMYNMNSSMSPPSLPPQNQVSPFAAQPTSTSSMVTGGSFNPMSPQRTGTNPFARTTLPAESVQPMAAPLIASPTGTNPFRQSMFVNQQTGQGWQTGQGTMGGLEQTQTMPVFPRPGQQVSQQQSPWG